MDDETVRLTIYGTFATTGRAPGLTELASGLGAGPGVIAAALERLAAARHVVLDAECNVILAHPFSSVPMGFSVMGARTLWWGGCAWDSFALPHLVSDSRVLVATTCPGCDRALAWNVTRESAPAGDELAHFLVPTQEIWNDVVHSCRHQRIFCGETCIATWLGGRPRGSVFDLATLWRLARHWYAGRLDRGYVRREPAAAKEYFRSVGLEGSFWGLP